MSTSLIIGTAGNDSLGNVRNDGADTIRGLDGDDRLYGYAGDDSLDGGNGDDTLYGGIGNDTLSGGAGDDSLSDNQGANLISGGSGDDSFSDVSGGDLGSTLEGGAGRDIFILGTQVTSAFYYAGTLPAADRIADFQAGPGGDRVDLRYALAGPTAWTATSPNPFVAGLFRLLQSGPDALLQLGYAGAWTTLLILGNTQANAVTADNIVQGWNPQGAAGLVLAGDSAANLISGGPDDDTITGQNGADTLLGGTGDDSLDGGAGNDCLSGGDGADTLSGGDANDTLLGYAGNDVLLGGDGDDRLDGAAGNDCLDGGAGNDTLTGGAGNDTLLGGDGNDSLDDAQGSNSLDGGAGNDIFGDVSGGGGGSTLSGGAGQDIFRLSDNAAVALAFDMVPVNPDRITDFQAGVGGDIFDFGSYLLSGATGWTNGTNPFSTGTLRALQSGADTLLQFDRDGPGGPAGWATLVILRSVAAADLVAQNFATSAASGNQPWNTAGGAAAPSLGVMLSGSAAADTLVGGEGNDSLSGQAGADLLIGNGGNDTLAGGDDADTLNGGSGNDSLAGGAGDDSLDGGDGADTLDGGSGADTLSGGSGNDLITGGSGRNLAYGGSGDDTFTGVSSGDGSMLSGGAGQDVYRIGAVAGTNPTALHGDQITDFTAGPGGDVLDLADLLQYPLTAGGLTAGANPFVAQYLRVVGSGADAVLQLDRDGPAGSSEWVSVLRLLDLNARSLSAANILQGWNPFGAAGLSMAGDGGNNSLPGGPDNDSIAGLAGNDTIIGGNGNDTLDGGTGNDSLAGGDGNDCIIGGTGTDSIDGGAGDDSIDGGDGNDCITGGTGADSIIGGDGDDIITLSTGANTIDAGAGNDTLIGIGGGASPGSLTGGSGADQFVLSSVPGYAPNAFAADVVTDFTAGAGGDQINGLALLAWSQLNGGWSNSANPFAAGYLRLVQSGDETLLQLDRDGPGGGGGWVSVLHLRNTIASAFTAANFVPYLASNGHPYLWTPNAPIDLTLQGTDGNDSLAGADGAQALAGLAGNDTLDGGAGADTLLGGAGDDYLHDVHGANSIDGGAGSDTIDDVAGGDTGSLLSGGAGQDRFILASAPGFDPDGFHPDVIADFTPGAGGDVLDIGLLLLWSQLNAGLDSATNPFRSGYLRLLQSGPDTLFQLDRDGPSGSGGFATVLTLRNTNAIALTIDNFSPVWALDNNPGIQNGTTGGDTLSGAVTNGLVDGGDGNDSLIAGPGDATLQGGDGADTLSGGSGADSLDGGAGDDLIIVRGTGFARVAGGAGADMLALSGAGVTLDLTALVPARLQGIEAIDLTGSGNNRLVLSAQSVLALSDTGTLEVGGNAGDRLSFADSIWTEIGTAGGLTTYRNETATVRVAAAITVDTAFLIAPLSASKPEGDSGSTPFTFTISRSGDTSAGGSVDWLLTGVASNSAGFPDFAAGAPVAGTLSFAPGQISAILTIAVAGDTMAESDESFRVVLSNPQGGSIMQNSATGTIVNDDIAFSIAATDASKPENNSGSTPFIFTVTRSGLSTGTDSVGWVASGAPGGAGIPDFVHGSPLSGRVTFAPGQTSQTITLHVAGDTSVEPDETFRVQLTSPSAGVALGAATGTILNDDSGFAITADTPSLLEGNGGITPFIFTVTRLGVIQGTASVAWSAIGAVSNSANPHDFAGGVAPAGTLSFAAGQVSQTITVNIQGDTLTEADEGFRVVLNRPSAGQSIVVGSASAIIRNDDTGYAIAADTPALAEGDAGVTPFTFTVTRSGDLSGSGSVAWSTTGVGPASISLDDLAGRVAPSGILTFAAGQATQTITINVAGDRLVESNEWFAVRLAAPSNGASLITASASAQVLNDDTGFGIAAVDAVKQEGNAELTPFTFVVSRSGNVAGSSTIGWLVSGTRGDSAGVSDFAGGVAPSGMLSFLPGETAKTLTIQVRGDTTSEPDENFLVQLHTPGGGGVILVGSAGGQILNDDGIALSAARDVATSLMPVAAADFNGDGITDLLRQAAGGALYLIDGATANVTALAGSAGMQFIAAAELNQDGCRDLLLRDTAGGLRAWLMQGAQVLHDDLLATPSAAATIAVGADSTGPGIMLHDPAATHPYALFSIGAGNVVTETSLDMLPIGWQG